MRLLIVEDEALIAMLIGSALEGSGHDVVGTAGTTEDAIAIARSERPELVLCDIKLLNGDSGLDVAAAMKAENIPCMFLSGTCPSPKIGAPVALGCLLKPFQTQDIEDAVQAACAISAGRAPPRLPPGMVLF